MRIPSGGQHLIALHCNDQLLPKGLSVFQEADVPWVNNVEVTVTQNDLLVGKHFGFYVKTRKLKDFLIG
tara:strand:- start:506 stop:712 length:207 start_codon:yes stop_codon:yes gene_type:complete